MNPHIKAKWVYDLKSGIYKQGKGFLKNNDKFCCLGVLCDIHQQEKSNTTWVDNFRISGESYFGSLMDLPFEVMSWAWLTSNDPLTKEGRFGTRLSELNDKDFDFIRIAHIIERDL